MAVTYCTDEIFAIGIKLEEQAASFYGKVAQKATDESSRKVFAELSEMEKKHAQLFTEMRKELSDAEKKVEISDPGNEMLFYMEETAKKHGWEGQKSPGVEFDGSENIIEILESAIKAEKEAVFLYTSFRDFVPKGTAKDKMSEIIREETLHAGLLMKQLRHLNK